MNEKIYEVEREQIMEDVYNEVIKKYRKEEVEKLCYLCTVNIDECWFTTIM